MSLIRATENGDHVSAEILLNAGVDVNFIAPKTGDVQGITALSIAAKRNDTHLIKLFVTNGANVLSRTSVKTCKGIRFNSPLSYVCKFDNVDTAYFLIKNGAHVNGRHADDIQPLNIAMEYGNIKVARFLLQNGATYRGKPTAMLINAIGGNRYDILKLHIEYYGSRWLNEVGFKRTVLEEAIKKKNKDILSLVYNSICGGFECAQFPDKTFCISCKKNDKFIQANVVHSPCECLCLCIDCHYSLMLHQCPSCGENVSDVKVEKRFIVPDRKEPSCNCVIC